MTDNQTNPILGIIPRLVNRQPLEFTILSSLNGNTQWSRAFVFHVSDSEQPQSLMSFCPHPQPAPPLPFQPGTFHPHRRWLHRNGFHDCEYSNNYNRSISCSDWCCLLKTAKQVKLWIFFRLKVSG